MDIVPKVYPQAYSRDDYMGWDAKLMLGDSVVSQEQFAYEGKDWIEEWARKKMDLDKAKRGEMESFTIDLEESF